MGEGPFSESRRVSPNNGKSLQKVSPLCQSSPLFSARTVQEYLPARSQLAKLTFIAVMLNLRAQEIDTLPSSTHKALRNY